MKNLLWTETFTRKFKRLVHQNPQQRLEQLSKNPFHPSLRTHKLKGEFSGIWSCSIDYSYRILFKFNRILFKFTREENDILLLTLGSHDEVY
ncbi:type II toxin-antitoxin system mRNA interferase toxin, RelE/StbE family [Crocosphaera sp. UHCC 0190]|uniref:type II toxin-antitoxin system RelE/ParE family toxin n=1 Tax=Crocosphaera sp. UHCC 0190 TaxID=3110246 RepID=UPI002B22150A|nr:type II toxin-antitoxin system mRNA interferase toxin, RelE/StbE family [Crocosphaera sp. UHCC 0190]MEA5510478.1 type II toxin-antitoxin system mRNA interferase toxin, RelE/StbE family [Crocosphaera sp. UHCC 0190]